MSDSKRQYAYGDLNRIEKPAISSGLKAVRMTPLAAMRQAALDTFKTDAIETSGPYKAIVLRVEPKDDSFPIGSWIKSVFSSAENPADLAKIKARIPELHAMLPEPEVLGSSDGPHQKIIDMYPTFVAQDDKVETPKEGDIVWVDFGNVRNFADPIYLGPVFNQPNQGGGGGSDSTAGNFGSNCANNLNMNSPTGDSILPYNGSFPTGSFTSGSLMLTSLSQPSSNPFVMVPFPVVLYQMLPNGSSNPKSGLTEYMERKARPIYQILVHHGATPSYKVTFSTLKQRGLSSHFEVEKDGTIYQYLDPGKFIAFHATNNNNYAIGIDLSGPAPDFTPLQLDRLADLICVLSARYGVQLYIDPYFENGKINRKDYWDAKPVPKNGIVAHGQTQSDKADPYGPATAKQKEMNKRWDELRARIEQRKTSGQVQEQNNALPSVPQQQPQSVPESAKNDKNQIPSESSSVNEAC